MNRENKIVKMSMLISLMMTFLSCSAQSDDYRFETKDYYFKKDTSNETGQSCKLYVHKNDTTFDMLQCYTNGKPGQLIARLFLKEGLYHGPCIYWNDDGSLSFNGEYFENKRNGKWKYYFSDKRVAERWFDKGRKVGVWKEFDKNGKVVSEINYGN